MQEAVDVLNDAQQRGLSVAELQAQASLFAGDERRSPRRSGWPPCWRAAGSARWGRRSHAGPRWRCMTPTRRCCSARRPPRQKPSRHSSPAGYPTPRAAPPDARGVRGAGRSARGRRRSATARRAAAPGDWAGSRALSGGAPLPVSCSRCVGTGKISPWAGMIAGCPTCSGTGQVVPTAPPPVAGPPQERLFNPGERRSIRKRKPNPRVVVESEAKTTRCLASDLRRHFRERWPARIRVHLVAATVKRTLDLQGRGALLQVHEGGELDLELTADLREALRHCAGVPRSRQRKRCRRPVSHS